MADYIPLVVVPNGDPLIQRLPAGGRVVGSQGGRGDTGPTGPSGTNGLNATQYVVNIGDGASTSIAVTHNLNTKDVTVTVIQNSDDAVLNDPSWVTTTVNIVTFTFGAAPSLNQYRAIILAGNSAVGPSAPNIDNYFV
jgi:hypothetical protein